MELEVTSDNVDAAAVATGRLAQDAARPGCVDRGLPVVELRFNDPGSEATREVQARRSTMTSGYVGDSAGFADADGWMNAGDGGPLDPDGWLNATGRPENVIVCRGTDRTNHSE